MVFEDIRFALPPRFFFDLPPAPDPVTLAPPGEPSIKAPFAIDPVVYNRALSPQIPITFAIAYFATVTVCNALNRRRGNKPFGVSKTRPFKALVLLHNFALALYSGITCVALVRALYVSLPGWTGGHGLADTVDALCKIHGPRGLGDAVTYDVSRLKWVTRNKLIHLGANNLTPDSTDVGRIWNEGLAFWGWFFYLSKYYEVVDTIIILLKGKRATTLQKYHHAGALLCMWAGMRYMSPPIWMFVLVNSGIHTLMYTFYTAATIGIRVPAPIKRSITTLQIIQFLVGAAFASLHLFISYKVPTPSATGVWSVVAGAASAAKGAPSNLSSILSSANLGAGPIRLPAWFKRLAYRAAGAEGLAENVREDSSLDYITHPGTAGRSPWRPFDEGQSPAKNINQDYTKAKRRHEMVHCLDTSGEAFAIWLNVVYLTPLTVLFLRFFWKSYILGQPSRTKKPASPAPRRLSESAEYAALRTSDTFEEYGTEFERSIGFVADEAQDAGNDALVRETVEDMRKGLKDARKNLGDNLANVKEKLEGSTHEGANGALESEDVGQQDVGQQDVGQQDVQQRDTIVQNGHDDARTTDDIREDLEEAGQTIVQSSSSTKKSSAKGVASEQLWFGRSTSVKSQSTTQTSSVTEQQESWTDISNPNLEEYLENRGERSAMDEQYIAEVEGQAISGNGTGPAETTDNPSWGFGLNG